MAAEKSIFEELAPYARMVVVPGVTVGNLTYSNQQDLYSTSVFSTGATGVVGANQQLQFFNAALGESAINQGYAGGTLSLGQTNSRFSKGQAPANQVYIATHAGFQLSQLSDTNLNNAHRESLLITETEAYTAAAGANNDLYTIAQNFAWNLTIGRGISRNIGTLAEYGSAGVWAFQDDGFVTVGVPPAATNDGNSAFVQLGSPCLGLKKLEVPLVFPPLINVQIGATNSSFFQLQQTFSSTGAGAGAINVQVRMILRGYLMTMPVG
jgi:hypothetical protein